MAQQPYQKNNPREESPSDDIKQAALQLRFSADPVPAELFDSLAETIAREFDKAKGKFNNPSQIRRFYDELVSWQQRINGNEGAFEKYKAFIRMMNAKVAYAKGRELVDVNFEHWFRAGINATNSARALDHFRLHFEAVLGFLKGLRG